MTAVYSIGNGISVCTDSDLQVCIRTNSDFWELPSTEKIGLLERARELHRFAVELEDFDRLIYNIGDVSNSKRMRYFINHLGGAGLFRTLCEDIKNNPFADEETKLAAQRAIDNTELLLGSDLLRRSATISIRSEIIKRDGLKCRYCGGYLTKKDVVIDHVIPYSLGGKTEINNLVASCRQCNSRKGGRTLEQANMFLMPI